MANLLSSSASPYLRQHASNPVAWRPWGEAAFAHARAEGKPLFLSIGYATCHWCHVMARESFEDPAVAEILNRHFVSIKVDREERPDVDRVYMAYVQALTGRGGWPMSVWLTPELKPFHGGTYFPPEDRGGSPGFSRLLLLIAEAWSERREGLLSEAERVVKALAGSTAAGPGAASAGGVVSSQSWARRREAAFATAFEYFRGSFDAEHGGFGGAPKFPQPSNLLFLLRFAARQPATIEGLEARRMVTRTLASMELGGVHDHVGGGYHRYSVDDAWFVPHFEKMLYDQAQLATVALEAWRATRDPQHAAMARDILEYVFRDLGHPEGGFFSAEDADSETADGGHREGAFYVWTWSELESVVGGGLPLLAEHFGLRPAGNIPSGLDPHGELSGCNHLSAVRPLAETASGFKLEPAVAQQQLSASLARLFQARAGRPRPLCDRKVVASWNGLMLSALARAAADHPDKAFAGRCAVEARRCVDFLRTRMVEAVGGGLLRSVCDGVRGPRAVAEDYACVIQGLLDLCELSFERDWFAWALELQERMDARFHDAEGGGYWDAASDATDIVVRLKDAWDGAEPAVGSVAALNLLRLAVLAGRPEYRQRALGTLEAFRSRWEVVPQALPAMLLALDRAVEGPEEQLCDESGCRVPAKAPCEAAGN